MKSKILLFFLLLSMVCYADTYVDGYKLDYLDISEWSGISEPSASSSGSGRVYFDSTSNTLKLSQDGGAYSNVSTDATVPVITGWTKSGTDVYLTTSTDSVGIGTSDPSSLLEVNAGTTGDAVLTVRADTDNLGDETDNPRIDFYQDGDVVSGAIGLDEGNDLYIKNSYVQADADIKFFVNDTTQAMTIEPSGQVGIGTVEPAYPLQVWGSGGCISLGDNSTSDPRIWFNTVDDDAYFYYDYSASDFVFDHNLQARDIYGYSRSPNNEIYRMSLRMHPENTGCIIPYYMNDISFNNTRGGSTTIDFSNDNPEAPIPPKTFFGTSDNLFDGKANGIGFSTWSDYRVDGYTVTVTIDFWKTFYWGTTLYISYTDAFRASDFVVSVYREGTGWVEVDSVTDWESGQWSHNYNGGGSGAGITKMKLVVTGYGHPESNQIFRIGEMGLVNYSSEMGYGYFVSRGGSVYGGDIYGDLRLREGAKFDVRDTTGDTAYLEGIYTDITQTGTYTSSTVNSVVGGSRTIMRNTKIMPEAVVGSLYTYGDYVNIGGGFTFGDSGSVVDVDSTVVGNDVYVNSHSGKGLGSEDDFNQTNAGIRINLLSGDTSNQVVTNYGIIIDNVSTGTLKSDNSYGIALKQDGDGGQLAFGESHDATMQWDGNHLVINTDETSQSGDVIFNTGTGGVGIGTTEVPTGVKLRVEGDIECSNVYTLSSNIGTPEHTLDKVYSTEFYFDEDTYLKFDGNYVQLYVNGVYQQQWGGLPAESLVAGAGVPPYDPIIEGYILVTATGDYILAPAGG